MHSIRSVVQWIKSSISDHKEVDVKSEESNFKEYLQFTSNDLETFINFLNDDPIIKDFLHFDTCNVVADKYLLAMTFVYFIRAGLTKNQYNRENFFSALYLAHEMEEDDEHLKYLITPWTNGTTIYNKERKLIRNELVLWKAMQYRTLVSKQACEEVISCIPKAKIWQRFRPECHSGAYRDEVKCTRCYLNMSPEVDPFHGFDSEDDLYDGQLPKRARLMEQSDEAEAIEGQSSYEVDVNNNTASSQDCYKANATVNKWFEE